MSKYFKFSNDIDDFRWASTAGKFGLLGKMALKTVANIGIYAVTDLPVGVAKSILANPNSTEEQKEKARNTLQAAEKFQRKFNKDK